MDDNKKLIFSAEEQEQIKAENEATELSPLTLQFNEDGSGFQDLQTENVTTNYGNVHVAIQGDRKIKTAMITLHDVGLNYISCFQPFFCFHQMQPLLHNFCVYHMNFPGQMEDDDEFPEDYVFPTMDDMADMIKDVLDHFGIKYCFCFGVGAGANVFIRLALKYPNVANGLILINGVCTTASWTEWGYQKLSPHYLKTKGMTQFSQDYLLWHYFGKIDEQTNEDLVTMLSSHYLKTKGMTQFSQDYLLWHYFGKIDEQTNEDLVTMVRDHFHNVKHPKNLALFIDAYVRRTAIKLVRPVTIKAEPTDTLQTAVLLICGEKSPHVDGTVTLNSKLDPKNSTWMKISDASGMVIEEQPTVVTNALILFLQGLGFALKARPPALSVHSNPDVDVSHIVC